MREWRPQRRTQMLINAFKRRFSSPTFGSEVKIKKVPTPYFEKPAQPSIYFKDIMRKKPKEGPSWRERMKDIQTDYERVAEYA